MTEKENKRNEMQRENNASKWSHNRKIGWKTLLMMRTEKWKRNNSNNETRHRQILLLKARKAFACSESKFALSFAFSLHNLARMQTHKRNNEHTHTSRARLYISRVELFFFSFSLVVFRLSMWIPMLWHFNMQVARHKYYQWQMTAHFTNNKE